MHLEQEELSAFVGRHLAIEPSNEVLTERCDLLPSRFQAQAAKALLQPVGEAMLVILGPGDRLSHRIDAGNRDQLGKRLFQIEVHACSIAEGRVSLRMAGAEFFGHPQRAVLSHMERSIILSLGSRVYPCFLPFVGSCPTCEGFFFCDESFSRLGIPPSPAAPASTSRFPATAVGLLTFAAVSIRIPWRHCDKIHEVSTVRPFPVDAAIGSIRFYGVGANRCRRMPNRRRTDK